VNKIRAKERDVINIIKDRITIDSEITEKKEIEEITKKLCEWECSISLLKLQYVLKVKIS